MVKRLISATASEIAQMNSAEQLQSIAASEGRVVVSENVVTKDPAVDDISNAELASAFGADIVLLNAFDVLNPAVRGIETDNDQQVVKEIKRLTGRLVGTNLEPVNLHADMVEDMIEIPEGRQATKTSLAAAEKLGLDFICLTGNPGTGVDNSTIVEAVKLAKDIFSGFIIAGKMHGAGVNEPVVDIDTVKSLLEADTDVILVPAVGTIQGFSDEKLLEVCDLVHEQGKLVMSTIGTSQETSSVNTIENIALRNKVCGVDIQHIGDAGFGGVATVENIYALSVAIRGVRHTLASMARSINR
ncbi:haloacid dehalogenase-like hydrolase [Lactobacillus sp. YT155]|uniref:DUF7916 family protein n=1 Tax=Lactobacillus sp. YT155 TaxID=3060955 RepID=UPI00265D6B1E|nr:haloacid dehalogenase-like hydrolase [Lactobacillus sp. YT155]MDO1604742.1 haloacid dehalogenase-like hydrolase [Lactobacillus sp. YT155]